jgi:hypothetical protein
MGFIDGKDKAGYSKLMGDDEKATVRTLKTDRSAFNLIYF